MKVRLVNSIELVKQVKVGFSWTTFFFLFFVPLFRGDWLYFFIFFILDTLFLMNNNFLFTFFLSLLGGLLYNKLYIESLLKKGWKPFSDFDKKILIMKGINLNLMD